MPNLDKFFEVCGIPQYVWKNAQEDSKIEPADVAEYSAIEQTISTWWISNKAKPLYWKIDQLQAEFEELNIGRFSETCLKGTLKWTPHIMRFNWICLVITRHVQGLISLHLVTLL